MLVSTGTIIFRAAEPKIFFSQSVPLVVDADSPSLQNPIPCGNANIIKRFSESLSFLLVFAAFGCPFLSQAYTTFEAKQGKSDFLGASEALSYLSCVFPSFLYFNLLHHLMYNVS